MRVTFVLPPVSMTGGIRVITIYGKALEKKGHKVFFVSLPQRRMSLVGKIKSFLKGTGWTSKSYSESFLDDSDLKHHILDRYRPPNDDDVPDADVIIATWWETAEWVLKMSPSKGKKFYFMQDYGAPGQELHKIIPTWKMGFEIVTISKWLKQLVLSHVPDARITAVPNSVDFEIFYAEPRSKQQVPTFGFLYVEISSKGYDTVLSAFKLARESDPSIKLLLFGVAPPTCELPNGTQFYLKPTDEEVRQIYASCDAWLFASVIEGFGLPILEAMACKTPVIATPAGHSLEVINETNGIIVPAQDVAAMADAILTVSKMKEEKWRTLSENAYKSVKTYTWGDASDRFNEIVTGKS